MHSIFKICISRNMKCDKTVGFLKYSHILSNVCAAVAEGYKFQESIDDLLF